MHPYDWQYHHHLWWMMGPIHMVMLLVVAWIVWIVPLYRILGRVGINPFWAFVAIFPPLGLVMLWIVAFTDWKPAGTKTETRSD